MKRALILAGILVLLSAAALLPVAAATSAAPAVKFFSTMKMISLENSPETGGYLDGAVAPIGWSVDGKFAYVEEIINEAAGWGDMGVLRWVVQDLVTDKILWNSGTAFEGLPDSLEEAGLAEIWQWEWANIKPYRDTLNKYKIKLLSGLAVERFPLHYAGRDYDGLIADLVRGTDEYEFEDMVLKYRVLLARGGKTKSVGEFRLRGGVMGVDIGGYVRSPYEPRIAIAVCEMRRGWEGPPHPVDCFFIGSHLEKGF